jgi:hypothetical protein
MKGKMMKTTLFLMLTISLLAQQKGPAAKSAVVKPPLPEIRSEDQAEDPPEFRRKYSATLTSKPGITMILECKDDRIWGDRECNATLRQSDEKSVSFPVSGRGAAYRLSYDNVADKVLDPVIVPEVKRLTEVMHLQDVKYKLMDPSEFKTADGFRWRKAQ